MKIIERTKEDKSRDWKIIPMHCYSLLYNTCPNFPICPKYCFHYSTKPMKEVAIAYYNGICNIREIAK
jgi:hypothetical protein